MCLALVRELWGAGRVFKSLRRYVSVGVKVLFEWRHIVNVGNARSQEF
jgi:hypothetical protein